MDQQIPQANRPKSKLLLTLIVLVFLIVVAAILIYVRAKNKPKEINTEQNQTTFSSKSNLNGPYYHSIYSATSADGINWTKNEKMLVDHASVPGAVIYDERIYLYYVDASGDNDQLSVKISYDNGKTFGQKQEVKIQNVKKWDAVDPHPEVINGKIRLYFLGDFYQIPERERTGEEAFNFYWADSGDGINFEQPSKIASFIKPTTDPDVFKVNNEYSILATQEQKMLLLEGDKEGKNFYQNNEFNWEFGGVSETQKIDGVFRTYYCEGGISSATGVDQKKLTKESGIRIFEQGKIACDPSIVELSDNTFMMFYKIQNINEDKEEKVKPQNNE